MFVNGVIPWYYFNQVEKHIVLSPHLLLPHPLSIDSMSEIILKNELYAATFDKGHLPLPPSKKLVIGMSISN